MKINANTEKQLKLSEYRQILAWYTDMGVDTAISETPINWLKNQKTINRKVIRSLSNRLSHKKSAHQQAARSHSTQFNTNQPETKTYTPNNERAPTNHPQTTAPLAQPSLERAKKMAAACNSLVDLQNALKEFDGCSLKRTAKNLVFYRGADQADLMIIGEAPGRDEDLVGKPFVGKAGQLLDRMLKAINLNEQAAHITNIVYWRPPGNRTPTIEESQLCRPFLDRQVELVNPKYILLLGGAAAKQIFNTSTGITKIRGTFQTISFNSIEVKTIATLHPADLIQTPIAKKMAWQDLQKLQKALNIQ